MSAVVFFAGIGLWASQSRIRLPLSAYLGLCWLIFIWALTYFSHQISGLVSKDEAFFATREIKSFLSNRVLWLLINQFTGLFTEDIIGTMRVLNLGFVVLVYLTAVRFLTTIHPLVLAVALSYAASVAALNIRDVAILFGVLLFLVRRGEFGHSLVDQVRALEKNKWVVVYLFLLRPLQVALLVMSGLRLYLLLIVLVGALAFLQTSLGRTYFYNFSYFTQNYSETITDKAEAKGLGSARPTLRNVGFWTARFIFAPSPVSITKRFAFNSGNYTYGRMDLGVRVLNRVTLYTIFVALLYYLFRAPGQAFQALQRYSFVIKFALLFSLLYALFNFGASHERVKMTLVVLGLYLLDRVRYHINLDSRLHDEDLLSHSYQRS